MKSKKILIFTFMFFSFFFFLGAKKINLYSFKPEIISLQNGGNLGAISMGIGYSFGKRFTYDINLAYGFTPSNIGGKTIDQLSLKNTFVFPEILKFKHYSLRPQLGLHITYNLNESHNVWLEVPTRYPGDYYFPTALQGIVSLGLRHYIQFDKRTIIAFMEACTTALYIRSYIFSDNMIIRDILNISFGFIFNI